MSYLSWQDLLEEEEGAPQAPPAPPPSTALVRAPVAGEGQGAELQSLAEQAEDPELAALLAERQGIRAEIASLT
ncbi:MAG: hypothetical protein H6741_33285, partial [Alphaproteobacteria bacterium]|nr:hypothetical protein [Alphaproteobacteria bacterium]